MPLPLQQRLCSRPAPRSSFKTDVIPGQGPAGLRVRPSSRAVPARGSRDDFRCRGPPGIRGPQGPVTPGGVANKPVATATLEPAHLMATHAVARAMAWQPRGLHRQARRKDLSRTSAVPVLDLSRQDRWQRPVVEIQNISLGSFRPFARRHGLNAITLHLAGSSSTRLSMNPSRPVDFLAPASWRKSNSDRSCRPRSDGLVIDPRENDRPCPGITTEERSEPPDYSCASPMAEAPAEHISLSISIPRRILRDELRRQPIQCLEQLDIRSGCNPGRIASFSAVKPTQLVNETIEGRQRLSVSLHQRSMSPTISSPRPASCCTALNMPCAKSSGFARICRPVWISPASSSKTTL